MMPDDRAMELERRWLTALPRGPFDGRLRPPALSASEFADWAMWRITGFSLKDWDLYHADEHAHIRRVESHLPYPEDLRQ